MAFISAGVFSHRILDRLVIHVFGGAKSRTWKG